MNSPLPVLAMTLAVALGGPAHADPCKAIPDRGRVPSDLTPGSTFMGPVTYIGDGDSLCVAATPGREREPATWVEVRLADFYAPELNTPAGRAAKTALEGIALGKHTVCKAGRQTYDRVVGSCRIGGISIGDRMRRAGVIEGGNGR